MARYQPMPPWRERDRRRWLILDDGDTVSTIVIEQADLRDINTGYTHQGGAYRVTMTNVPGKRTKTFKGETAWMNARRYAADAASDVFGDWRWWPDL